MTSIRGLVASWQAKLACHMGAHTWQVDSPPDRPVFLHRRHCTACQLRQVRGIHPDAEWTDVGRKA